jgi:hypothetical protein
VRKRGSGTRAGVPPFEKGNGGRPVKAARPLLPLWGVEGQRSSRGGCSNSDKDVISSGVAWAGGGVPAAASRAAAGRAGGLRGRERNVKPDGTRRNRNGGLKTASRREREHSSRGGRTGTRENRWFFRASAYPRGGPTRRPLWELRGPSEPRVASREGSGEVEERVVAAAVADSVGLVAGGADGRCRWRGTSAGRASAASVVRPADRQASSNGTEAVRAESIVDSL